MAGTISLQEFRRCVAQLLAISDQLADGWTFNEETPEAAYLVKKLIVPDTDSKVDVSVTALHLEEPLEDVLEDENAIAGQQIGMLTWEYHVLYSHSYSVPALYFNAWTSDGRLLSLESIWHHVHANFQSAVMEDRWSVLTQQEHPALRRPFYLLHPCRTAEFLDCFQGNSSNIVITWLSSVGPVVGLTLDPRYGQIVSTK